MKIELIIMIVLAVVLFAYGILQLFQKGFLFNNAYIYASKEEKLKMNKKPYYIQSGIILLIVAVVMALNAVQLAFEISWVLIPIIALCIIAVIYAIVSTGIIQRNRNR